MTFHKWLTNSISITALQLLAMTQRDKARLWRSYEAAVLRDK